MGYSGLKYAHPPNPPPLPNEASVEFQVNFKRDLLYCFELKALLKRRLRAGMEVTSVGFCLLIKLILFTWLNS